VRASRPTSGGYTAYWVRGLDIGSPEVPRTLLAGPILRGHSPTSPLREQGYAVSVTGAPMTTDAWRRIRRWREEWTHLDVGELPALVVHGAVYTGESALRRLDKELVAAGVDLNPSLPDAARYPTLRIHAPMDWVSRGRGSWAYTWYASPLSAQARC
jgi:hypothetical protein